MLSHRKPTALPAPSAEFDFLVRSCNPARPFERPTGPLDADHLLDLARWHRVEALLDDAMNGESAVLASEPAAELAARAGRSRKNMFDNAQEEARIAAMFATAGIDAVFIKGATLAHLFYANPLLKRSRDIDVLIDRADLVAARATLQRLGYAPDLPDGLSDARRIDRWFEANKDTNWTMASRDAPVELHTALADTSAILTRLGMGSPRQHAKVFGVSVATFATPELFAYLCVHGTIHQWARLKWLVDLAVVVQAAPDIDALYDAAVAAGAGRCPAVGLGLCAALFDMPMPAAAAKAVARDRHVRWLIAASLARMRTHEDDDRTLAIETIAQILAIQRTQFLLAPGIGYKVRTLWSQLQRPYAASLLSVPRWLQPLWMLVWVPARLLTRGRRAPSAID